MSQSDIRITPVQTPHTRPNRRFASLRAILALVLREMSSRYARNPGGYLWAILEPVAGILLLTLLFSAALRSPSLGISFPVFYASGLLPFSVWRDLHAKVAQSLLYSRPLLAYPTVTFIDAIFAAFITNLITQLMISYLVLTFSLTVFEHRASLNLPILIEAYALAALLGLGMGTLNAFLFTRFPLFHRAWSVLTMPLFLISGIFFLFDAFPAEYKDALWWNPLVHIVGLARRGFYPTYDAEYVSTTYVLMLALICFTIGLVFMRRHHRDLFEL